MENNKYKLFVGGDISGIQKFIYNISSKKAAASLKGRSAWLDKYLREVYDKILAIPGIKSSPLAKDIYCGGGKFYLIASDDESVKTRIEQIRQKEEEYLWNEHKGLLAINIALVPYQEDFGLNFVKANEEFAKQKNRKFESLLRNKYDEFFEVQKVGGTPQVCAITGVEGKTVPLDKDKEILVLPSVKEQVENGYEIRKRQGIKQDFEDYARDSYLGVLRMDVDGLGAAFRSRKTLEEYRTFSNRLTAFFKEDLDNLWHTDDFHDWTDIIYAGGDDLFVVGRWNVVVDFAKLIHDEFSKIFPGNTLSGGIAIVKKKFPIAKAAELAGDAEEASKHFGYDKEKDEYAKNAFTMLGVTISWDEYEYVHNFKEQFIELCNSYNMPRSILHHLMQLNEMRKRGEMSYLWNTAYFLKRFSDGKSENIKAFCKDLKDNHLISSRKYELIALACRWAELETKKQS